MLLSLPRARVGAPQLLLVSLLAVLLPASRAGAGCDNIPSETDVFRSAQGAISAPFAIPGQAMQVRVRPDVCDVDSAGLGAPPACLDDAAVRVTLIFEARDAAPAHAVVMARECGDPGDPTSLAARVATWSSELGAGASAVCQSDPHVDVVTAALVSTEECRLDFRFPTATGPTLALPDTLTGPARIVVEPIASPLPTSLVTARCADAIASSQTIACIDELYRSDGSCSTQASSVNGRFPAFTALPIPNDFAAMADGAAARPALRFALDAAGNVLAPMSWSGVLCQNDPSCTFEGFPPPQLVQVLFPQSLGSGLDASGQPVASGVPLSIPSGEFTSSHTLAGKELPPIFDPSTSTASLALFGSTDAVQTVIRLQIQAPGRCSGDARPCISDAGCADSATAQSCDLSAPDQLLADLRYCRHPNECQAPDLAFSAATVSGGPGLIPASLYTATKGGYVPLEALNLCRNSDELSCVLKNEPLAGDVDANGDGDITDPSVIELRDRRAGTSLPIGFDALSGLATTLLFEPPAAVGPFGDPLVPPSSAPSIRPAVATDGSCAALLFAEPWENALSPLGIDANGDGEAFNPILRVFCRTAPGVIEEVAGDGAATAGIGSLLGASIRPLLLASPRTLSPLQGGGEPIVFAGDRLYFLLDELANSPKGNVRMDVNALGEPAVGPAFGTTLSFGGNVACFTSRSDLLASGSPDTSHFGVYCRDFETGAIDLASREQAAGTGSLCGEPVTHANASSYKPSLSGDGRFVCFDSDARNLVGTGADTNFARDVFVYDRTTCRSVRISVTAGGGEAVGASNACSLAGDAGFAAFSSTAQLVPQDVDTDSDVYLVPLVGGTSDGDPLQPGTPLLLSDGLSGPASAPSLSADGTRVAFELAGAAGPQTVVRNIAGNAVTDAVGFGFEGAEPKLSQDGHSLTLVITDPATHLPTALLVDLLASIARNEPVVQPLALTSTLQDVDAKSFEAAVQTHTAAFVSPQPLTPLDSPSNIDTEVHVRDLDNGFVKRIGEGSRFPSLSGDGSVVAYLTPAAGGSSAFRNGPLPGAEVDFDGNGSAKDLVLAAIDLGASPPGLEVIGATTQAAMDGSIAAFLAPSGQVFVRNCPAGTSCAPTPLLAPDGASHARASAVAVSASIVCAILSPGAEVACAAPGDSALTDLGVTGRALGVVGDDIVLMTGDQPARLMAFRRTGATFALRFTGGPGTRRFVLSENGFAAFDRCEADAAADLNGDGFEDECVLDVLDLGEAQLVETHATVQPCTLEACDRRFPWRVFPAGAGEASATARFLSLECQEDGDCGGCTPQSCPVNGRACDLDGDGDCAGVVVREFTVGAATPLVIATLSQQIDSDPLAGDVSGGVGGQGAVFPTLIGRCDVDDDPATEASTRACQTSADCPPGQLCGPPFSALALNDADGDGSFDGFDNCPDSFNPDQADGDGNGIGDACQANRCGDGVVTASERCDDGARNGACDGLSLDQCRALGDAGSFCDASCVSQVFVKTDPAYGGLFPTTMYGTPLLNLGDARDFDGSTCAIPGGCPDSMVDPTTLRLEAVPAGGACSGPGASMYGSYLEDVNHDGLEDRITKFRVADIGQDPGDTQVCLSGELRAVEGRFDAAPFVARANLATKRCGFGAELAPILVGLALWRRRIARGRRA